MSKQSRKMSLLESVSNVVVGYGIATTANYFILPLFGYNVSLLDSAGIGLAMTVISIVRSYALRRGFETLRVRETNSMRISDQEFLNWIADRIVHVYKESPNVDFVLNLRRIAESLK